MHHLEDDCPFCGSMILSSVFLETSEFLAIYNYTPILPGHSLIIPRRHVVSLLDLDQAALCRFTEFSRRVTVVLLAAFAGTSFDWTIQDGVDAGQTVQHLHLHIIPRSPSDLSHPGGWYKELTGTDFDSSEQRRKLSLAELGSTVSRLKLLAKRIENSSYYDKAA